MNRFIRTLQSVVLLLLVLVISDSCSNAQDGSPKRTKLDAFQVTIEPLDQELTNQDQLLVRYELEQVLSQYLMEDYTWPSATTVIFVAVARILEYVTIGSTGAQLTFDGLIYFDDASTDIPSSQDLAPLVADALVPEKVIPALQKHFPSVDSVSVETSLGELFTDSPTNLPTPAPTTATPTVTPTIVPTKVPTVSPTPEISTDSPTRLPTAFPTTPSPTESLTTSEPTLSPSTRAPTSMSLTASPLSPTEVPVITPEPTTSPTTIQPSVLDATLSPSLAESLPEPTLLTTLLPTTTTSSLTTPAPQIVSEAVTDQALSASDDTNPGMLAGAITGGLLLLLVVGILVARNRQSEDSSLESTNDILNDLKECETGTATEPSPDKTMVVTSLQSLAQEEGTSTSRGEGDAEAVRASKGVGFMKYFGKQTRPEEPPHLAMTDGSDAGESDASDFRSDGDHNSTAELNRGCWPRSTASASAPSGASVSSSGASAMVNSVESFERRQLDKHMIRKDILESPDLTAASLSHYKTGQALMASMNNEDDYDCALAPTDMSAASLAMKPRSDGDEDEELAHPRALQTVHSEDTSVSSRNSARHEREEEGELFSAGLAGLFNSWWGTSKSKRQGNLLSGESTDDDTFGGQGEWDPDDETRTSDEQSQHFKSDVGEESLLDSTKNVTYQMQRLRTPPEGPESRPKPITSPVGPRQLRSSIRNVTRSMEKSKAELRSSGSSLPPMRQFADGRQDSSVDDVYDL